MNANEKKDVIKERYGKTATIGGSCCSSGCCGDLSTANLSKSIGYSENDINAVPDANLDLGCENPVRHK